MKLGPVAVTISFQLLLTCKLFNYDTFIFAVYVPVFYPKTSFIVHFQLQRVQSAERRVKVTSNKANRLNIITYRAALRHASKKALLRIRVCQWYLK